jgi:hypothetical protein
MIMMPKKPVTVVRLNTFKFNEEIKAGGILSKTVSNWGFL